MAERIETLLAAERRLLLDISHELRSPLARLGVAVELARSGDDLDSALNRIQKESDRVNSLVGQLLQVTRAEGDPSSLRRNPVRLDVLVQQLVDESTIEAAARGCSLQYEKHDVVTVEGDPELLRRAVENVMRNAIRYSPPESPVDVSVARRNGSAVRGRSRSWPRRPGRVAAAALRSLLPRGKRPGAQQRRHRAGAVDRAPGDRVAQGQYSRAECRAGAGSRTGVAGDRVKLP